MYLGSNDSSFFDGVLKTKLFIPKETYDGELFKKEYVFLFVDKAIIPVPK